MELYEVGGCVRDEILGLKSKDIDFSVVLTSEEVGLNNPFVFMQNELKRRGFRIYKSKPEYLTIRAQFPRMNGHPALLGKNRAGLDADFVLARKEGAYTDGRRPDKVEVGTLEDDLARRDFTMNAIAKDAQGNLIDPFGGVADIKGKVIRCVGDAYDRIVREDALRGLRALRFSVTKQFMIDYDVDEVLLSSDFRDALTSGSTSTERIREELEKMFKADTYTTLSLIRFYNLTGTLFDNTGLRLMPTMKG